MSTLAQFSASLRRLPTVVAQKVAAEAAPVLTAMVRQTFEAGTDAFGGSWKIRADGTRATLRKSGDLARHIKYVAIGTKVRIALGVAYARYQIGTRPVAPKQGEGLPVAYARELSRITADVCRAEIGR